VLDYIPKDTFILVIVYEHNGNVLLEYKENRCVCTAKRDDILNVKNAMKPCYNITMQNVTSFSEAAFRPANNVD
jgi:hypothetical protein